jgi:hypothetical protein
LWLLLMLPLEQTAHLPGGLPCLPAVLSLQVAAAEALIAALSLDIPGAMATAVTRAPYVACLCRLLLLRRSFQR